MKVIPLRLPPGAGLRRALEAWMGKQQGQAGCVMNTVGSLSLEQLRLAGATQATAIHGELEILSLSGTLSPDGAHLHIARHQVFQVVTEKEIALAATAEGFQLGGQEHWCGHDPNRAPAW